jgi:hypothetical protein
MEHPQGLFTQEQISHIADVLIKSWEEHRRDYGGPTTLRPLVLELMRFGLSRDEVDDALARNDYF